MKAFVIPKAASRGSIGTKKNMATDFYNSLDYPSFIEANKKWPKAKRKKGHVNTKIETHVATGKCFITFHTIKLRK